MALGWIIDPGSAQFDLNDLSATFVRAQSCPMPVPRAQYVSAVDVDGDTLYSQNYGNRTITLVVEVKGTTATTLETAMGHLHQKIAAINREAVLTGVGGALQYTSPSTKAVTFDVCSVSASPELAETYFFGNLVTVTLTFECLPLGRGTEGASPADHTETTLPWLVFTETGIEGDAEALGRLVVDEDQGADQWWLTWGVQSRNYDSSADAALAYQAESRTRLASSTTAGTSGASAGICVRSASLGSNYAAVLGTQATGGGNHLSHVGEFRAFARVQTLGANTGAVSVALEWARGDFLTSTRNAAVTFPANSYDATWRLVDLGLVSIPQGTARWEGRMLARSTVAGDQVDVDWLMLVPTREGSGEVAAQFPTASPTSVTARDEWDQTAGALSGKTLPIGGTWSGAGDTDDFAINATAHTAQRTAISDVSFDAGRFAIAGTSTLTNCVVQVDVQQDQTASLLMGVLARYIDTNNWLIAYAFQAVGEASARFGIRKRVAGTTTTIGATLSNALTGVPTVGRFATVRLVADASGRFFFWVVPTGGGLGTPTFSGQDPDLATGGALASGKVGIYDSYLSGAARTRTFDNFFAAPIVPDAALYASQSCELRHNGFTREDSAGALSVDKTIEGDYLLIPPAGREGRTLRVIAKASRNAPTAMPDTAIDDISAQLFVTPRYLSLPE